MSTNYVEQSNELQVLKEALKQQEKNNSLLKAIALAQTQFIVESNPRIAFNVLLDNLLIITESEYGFIGEVFHTENGEFDMKAHMKVRGNPYLKTHAITNIAWNEETRAFYDENAPRGMVFNNLKTLFGTVLVTGEPVISNSPSTDPRRGGIPEGHPPLNAFLGIPFYSNKELVGMVGIANCPSGYDEAVIDYLQPFLATCSNLIQSHRDYKLRQEAEGALRESQEMLRRANEDLENRVKQRTQQLQEAKLAADSANKAKSEFLANMSHELRTPLNGILGYTQILHRSQLTEDGRKGVDIIHQCASHLLTLINDVLDLSKIEAQKMELYPVDFHFPSFLEGVAEICRIRAEQKDIAFIYQPDTQIPIGIKADEKRLRQVLINLLGNAIKFTDFGEVTFRVKTAFNEAASIYKIRFEIEDTGVGMAPEQLEKIFLPFEQVGESIKQSEGTGLGLAISGKIISLMDSKIEVQSELGKGSIFAFEVELPEAPNWAQSSKVSKRGAIIGYEGKKQKVLVVDDKWENRSVIVKLLEPLDFEMAEAQNGQQGLEKGIEFQPDIIITDLVMPVMHGFEFMKNLRALPQFENVVIIASSASVFDTDQYKSLDAGAAAFLPKPISADALFEMLSKHLEIEWLYQHNSEQSTQNKTNTNSPNKITIPSQEVLEYLYEIARKGDIKKISFEAEKLKEASETLIPFADKIINLSERYQIKLIRDFLKGLLDN
ncbi:hypothetical protein NIES2101_23760 [Calothrix sp. HK-06]|nr:hypothetical protein NIES2101_23760 [Calothrix sp. HK-06]